MKNVIILIFLPLLAFGQRIVTKDSTWQANSAGQFYDVRIVEYSTGESSLTRTLRGDTNAIFQAALNSYISEGNRMANEARSTSQFDRIIKRLIQQNDEILTATGRDVLDSLAAKYAGPLLAAGWTAVDTGTLNIGFSVNASGQLRYTLQGFPARNATLIASTLRLNNYGSTGRPIDLFQGPGGNWFSMDDGLRLRFPGNISGNRGRDVQQPPQKTGVLIEYFFDSSGKVQFFAGDSTGLKKSGSKYVVTIGGKKFELIEKK
jgi:hypothetical protein